MRLRLDDTDRLRGAVAAIVVQVLLGWGLIAGLGSEWRRVPEHALAVFRVAPPPPPPPVDAALRPDARLQRRDIPAVAPLRATPVVAPPPVVPLTVISTIVTAARPSTGAGPTGSESTGVGGGGSGTGSGSGGAGNGAPPLQLRGEIRDSDYPKAAARENRSGGVDIRYLVGTDGRIARCGIVRSSGSADLDETACRLAQARFLFEPAVDASGRRVPAWVDDGVEWVNHPPPSTP